MLSARELLFCFCFFPLKLHESKRQRDGNYKTAQAQLQWLNNMQVLNSGNSASFYSQPNLIKPDNKRWKLESYSGEIKM